MMMMLTMDHRITSASRGEQHRIRCCTIIRTTGDDSSCCCCSAPATGRIMSQLFLAPAIKHSFHDSCEDMDRLAGPRFDNWIMYCSWINGGWIDAKVADWGMIISCPHRLIMMDTLSNWCLTLFASSNKLFFARAKIDGF